jgi:hypothetical protein
MPCPDCRIELVGLADDVQHPLVSGADLTVTLGDAHAVGQPLPIMDSDDIGDPESFVGLYVMNGRIWYRSGDRSALDVELTAALAHYGPPETLVGRWAIQLRVVQ